MTIQIDVFSLGSMDRYSSIEEPDLDFLDVFDHQQLCGLMLRVQATGQRSEVR